MDMTSFDQNLQNLVLKHEKFLSKPNSILKDWHNGVYERYETPVVTANIMLQSNITTKYHQNQSDDVRIEVNSL